MHKTILVLEDSPLCQRIAQEALKQLGKIVTLSTCAEARKFINEHQIELLIIDMNLPDGNGMDFYNELLNNGDQKNISVIFVTGDGDLAKKVAAFTYGAADYIVKPYAPIELRVRAERIFKLQDTSTSVFKDDIGLHLDLLQYKAQLSVDGIWKEIDLTPQEFKLLHLFSKNRGRIFSRQQIIDQIWGHEVFITPRTVDTHISSLRKKIVDIKLEIISVRGEGYKSKLVA